MNIIIRRALSSTGLSLITFFHLHNVNNLSEQNCSLAKSLTSRRNCPDIPTSSSSSSCFCCCVLMSVRLSGFLERPCHVYRCISTRWKFRMKQDYYFFREIPCMEPMFPLSCARVCARIQAVRRAHTRRLCAHIDVPSKNVVACISYTSFQIQSRPGKMLYSINFMCTQTFQN